MSGGVGAALEEAVKGEAGMAEIVQAGLFEELEPCETGALDAPSPLSAALPSAGRRPGRPKGSKNRRTEAVTAWLLTQHRHPLSVIMEAYTMTPVQLAERLGLRRQMVTRTTTTTAVIAGVETVTTVDVEEEGEHFANDVLLDLFKLQMRMAESAAPYIAQKLPQAVQIEGGASLTVNFGGVDLDRSAGVSVPARGGAAEISVGDGMSVRLGQVGRDQSDGDVSSQ